MYCLFVTENQQTTCCLHQSYCFINPLTLTYGVVTTQFPVSNASQCVPLGSDTRDGRRKLNSTPTESEL